MIQPLEQTGATPAGVATATAAEPPLLEPAFSVTIDAPAQFRGIVFHPDGTKAFVHVSDPAIDLWPLAVYYWPEILGGLAALLTLPALGLIWRRARRPRRVGRVYCRKCNYELGAAGAKAKSEEREANIGAEPAAAAAVPQRCPECGTETAKRRPIPGRRMRRRLALPVAWVLVIAAEYGAMHAGGLPREGWVSERYSVHSRLVRRVQHRLHLPYEPWSQTQLDRVMVMETLSGRFVRTLCAPATRSRMPMVVSGDGATLLLVSADTGTLAAIDSRSGRVVARLAYALPRDFYHFMGQIIPCTLDPRTVYIVAPALVPNSASVRRWRIGDGSATEVFTLPSFSAQSRIEVSKVLVRLPASVDACWLSPSSSTGSEATPPGRTRLLDERGGTVREFPFRPGVFDAPPAILSGPTPSIVTAEAGSGRLHRAALPDGDPLPPICFAPRSTQMWSPDLEAGGSRLLTAMAPREAWVYDAGVERGVARLVVPLAMPAGQFGFSVDGRFAFAFVPESGNVNYGPRPRAQPETVLVWDLSRIPPAAGEPSPSGP